MYSDSEDYLPSRIGITTIATSQAEAYAGVFNFDFRDERYLPFEGAGVDSSWRLELPKEFRQFEYESISDVVLRISYTARNGAAENVKQNIINDWGTKKSAIRLSAIDSGALERLQNGETISIKFMKSHFPAIARVEGLLNGLEVYCRFKEGCSAAKMTISSNEVQISNGVIGDSQGPFTLWGGDACSVASGYNISITPDDDTTLTGVEDLIFVHEYTLGKII